MWSYEHSIDSTATPAALWARYADTATWSEWDREVEEMTVDGPFVTGARCTLTLHGRPPALLVVTEATPGIGFSSETQIPDGIVLRFIQHLAELPTGTRMTHRVEIEGPLADEQGPVLGPEIVHPIPDLMLALSAAAATRTG